MEQVGFAQKFTFEWLFEEPKLGFESWLQAGHGLYWIRGKPASGKSTLMKMAYNHPRTERLLQSGEEAKARAALFFHDRGSEVQKSLDGLLRSILHQILSNLPRILPLILPIYQRIAENTGAWSTNELQRAFNEVLSQTIMKAEICLFLDALDEYSGGHESMANFLNQIVNTKMDAYTRIKVCFSSRPLQIFLDRFQEIAGF
jgi:hypothetical protein